MFDLLMKLKEVNEKDANKQLNGFRQFETGFLKYQEGSKAFEKKPDKEQLFGRPYRV